MTPLNAERAILGFLAVSVVAGALGAAALEAAMFLITRAEWARMNMVVALGSLLTRSREGAFRTGVVVHSIAAVFFAALYTFAMTHLGLARLPGAFFAGLGFGVVHGLLVSLILVWMVCERHPLEEFQEAGLAVGLTHFAGHVAYGGAVGLVVGLAYG